MNSNLRTILTKYNIPINKITLLSNAKIIDNQIVVKEIKNKELPKTYNYLKSRSFDYFPEPIDIQDNYEIYPYIKNNYEPKEQKAMDLMYLLSLLHSKTTFYREVDIDHNKETYETITNQLEYLNNYYTDLITTIEKQNYMSPSSYLIARNINIIFDSIYYAKDSINTWYKKIENTKNERVVNIHNNITLDHYIKNEKPYLISWNKSKIDSPIYDLLSFYKNHNLELDFDDLLHYYESNYPLKEEEKLLLFSQMAIPDKIELENNEYKMCIKINKMIDYLYKTNILITNYQKKW